MRRKGARGSTAEEFAAKIDESLAKKPKRIVLVSHTYLGGHEEGVAGSSSIPGDSDRVSWASNFEA